jgi:hypothetical protein
MTNNKPIEAEILPAQAVAIRENASELMKRTTDVAGVCREIVLKCACNIQGKKYVKCEGWMAIATAHGCIAGSRDVKKVEGGWTAIGEIRRISDGVLLAQAEGFVGQDEKRWGSANEYACRAMAQTRAISRACRAAFAHVVVLMDAGLSTTPYEEVPAEGFHDAAANERSTPVKPAAPPASRPAAAPQPADRSATARPAPAYADRMTPEGHADEQADGKPYMAFIVPKFIKKYAGLPVGNMEPKDLEYWATHYEPKPWKGKISQADLDFKAALDAAYADLLDSGDLDSDSAQEGFPDK